MPSIFHFPISLYFLEILIFSLHSPLQLKKALQTMERFSIRDYTSKMRSTDVLKCWPFHETNTLYIETFLPPIAVQKFKWWADELHNEAAAAAMEDLSCPVYLQVMDSHVDKCVAQSPEKEHHTRTKAKSRAPKKRSIVEIFAVTPQVENAYDDKVEHNEEEEKEDGSGDHVKLSALIRVNLNDKMKRKLKLKVDKLKQPEAVHKKQQDGVTTNPSMEKFLKLKHIYPLGSKINFHGKSHTVGSGKLLSEVIHVQKKKPRLRCSVAGKQTTDFQTSMLTSPHHNSVPSIFENSSKHPKKVASGKKTTIGTLFESSESERRIRFPGKDDIIGQRRKTVPPNEFPKVTDILSTSLDAAAASLETNLSSAEVGQVVSMEVTATDRSSSFNKGNNCEARLITENQSADMCLCMDETKFLRPHTAEVHLPNRPVSPNQASYGKKTLWLEQKVASSDPSSACPTGFLSTGKVAYYLPNLISWQSENTSISSNFNSELIAHYSDTNPGYTAMCSRDYVTAFSQPSSSSQFTKEKENEYRMLMYPSETRSDNYDGQKLQYYPFHHLTPKDVMHSICSLPDLEQRGLMHLESSTNENIIGLPLNSQREFVHFHSSGNGGFNQMGQANTFADSSRSLALCYELPSNLGDHITSRNCDNKAPSEKQFQLFPAVEDHVKEKPNFHVSSGIGSTRRSDVTFLDYLRGSNQSFYPLKSGLDPVSIPRHMKKQNDLILNYLGDQNMQLERNCDLMSQNVSQKTMRLMGQEFLISKNSRNFHEDKMIWMNKQIMAAHHHADTITNTPLNRHFRPNLIMPPACGKGKKIASSSKVQINLVSQSVLQIKPPDSRFSQPSLGCQTDSTHVNAFHTFGGDRTSRSCPCFPVIASPAPFRQESIFQEPYVCEYGPPPINPQLVQACSHQNAFQNLGSEYAQYNRKQTHPYSTSSAFKFPFLRSDLGGCVGPSSGQSSFTRVAPWLNATHVKETMMGSFHSYSDALISHHQAPTMSNTLQKTPSVCCTPDASFGHNPFSIQSPLQNVPNLATLADSSSPSVGPLFWPNSTKINKGVYRMKYKQKMKRLCVKDPIHEKRTKKRSTTNSYSSRVTSLKSIGDTGVDALCRREIIGLDSARDVANSMVPNHNETAIYASKAITEVDPLKLDDIATSSPVKLTAGAKHILKPSENINKSISKLTHSNFPSASGTSSGMDSESQMKSAKIY